MAWTWNQAGTMAAGADIQAVTPDNGVHNGTGGPVVVRVHIILQAANTWLCRLETSDGQHDDVGVQTAVNPNGRYYYGTVTVGYCGDFDPDTSSSSSQSDVGSQGSDEAQLKPYARDTPAKQAASVKKASRRYGSGVRAIVPEQREAVLAAFEDVHLTHPWIVSIGMSGSALFDGFAPRDLDVILMVSDYGLWMQERDTLVLPRQIDGKKCDIFAAVVPLKGDHAVLDLYSLQLYAPLSYNIIGVDAGIKVVRPTVAQPVAARYPSRVGRLTTLPPPCTGCSRSRRK